MNTQTFSKALSGLIVNGLGVELCIYIPKGKTVFYSGKYKKFWVEISFFEWAR